MDSTGYHPELAENSASVRTSRIPTVLVGVLFLVMVLWLASRVRADPDLWGHLRFGLDSLAAHGLTAHDPYSFTSDRAWVNHEWLAEAAMAASYRLGPAGLVLLAAAILATVVGLIGAVVRQCGVKGPAGVALVALAVYGASPQLATLRPQLFSVLLFAALLWVVGAAEQRRGACWLVLPLFVAWANLHGGWIVGLGVLALWAVAAVRRGRVPLHRAVLVVAAALVVTAANPYGSRLWTFLAETVGLGRADIEEWQPAWRAPADLVPWVICAVPLAWGWWRSPGRRWAFLPAMVLAVLSLQVVRLQAFFGLSTVASVAPAFAGLGPQGFPLTKTPTKGDLLIVGSFAAVVLAAALLAASRTASCLPMLTERVHGTPEAEAAEFLSQNRIRGRLLTWFDYGEYAIWHLSPGLLVSYDGRRETVYSERVQDGHWRFYRGHAEYAKLLRADYIWLPASLPVVERLLREGWTCIFRGPRSVVLAAKATPPYTQPASFAGPRCFPGP
jgi:hypothetical protein